MVAGTLAIMSVVLALLVPTNRQDARSCGRCTVCLLERAQKNRAKPVIDLHVLSSVSTESRSWKYEPLSDERAGKVCGSTRNRLRILYGFLAEQNFYFAPESPQHGMKLVNTKKK